MNGSGAQSALRSPDEQRDEQRDDQRARHRQHGDSVRSCEAEAAGAVGAADGIFTARRGANALCAVEPGAAADHAPVAIASRVGRAIDRCVAASSADPLNQVVGRAPLNGERLDLWHHLEM